MLKSYPVLPPFLLAVAALAVGYPLAYLPAEQSMWCIPPLVFSTLMILDANARYREYDRLREFMARRKWSDAIRLTVAMRRSWCGRHAATAAWEEVRLPRDDLNLADEMYHARGYRWWHFLPDGSPWVFFKRTFWRQVVGLDEKAA